MDVGQRRARRNAIDVEIEAHQCAIRALEFERNTFLSVNLLPDELLAKIFSFMSTGPQRLKLATRTGLLSRDGTVLPPWLLASQVCVRWRTTILAASALNRQIDMTYSTQWTTQIIRRASASPGLGFFARLARSSPSAIRRFTTILQNHHHTIEQIELACGSASEDILTNFFIAVGTGPRAEVLEDTSAHNDQHPPTYKNENTFRFDILNQLDFRGQRGTLYTLAGKLATPLFRSLRHLYLYNVVLGSQFPPGLLGQLSKLDLTYDLTHVGTLSIECMLKHMKNASLVEHLALRLTANGTGALPDEDITNVGVVAFPSLRVLELEAPGRRMGKLLGVIYAPVARVIELKSDAWANAEGLSNARAEVYGLTGSNSEDFRPGLATQVWHCLCVFHDRGMFLGHMTVLNGQAVARVDWTSANGARLSLLTDHPRSPITVQHTQALHGALDEAVTFLQLTCAPRYPKMLQPARTNPTLGWIPSLNALLSLSLAYDDGAAFLTSMASESGAGVVALPRLRKLSVHGMRYSSLANDLVDWIEDRSKLGEAEFEELVITGYDDAEDHWSGLSSDELTGVLIALLESYVDLQKGRKMRFIWEWKVVDEWNI